MPPVRPPVVWPAARVAGLHAAPPDAPTRPQATLRDAEPGTAAHTLKRLARRDTRNASRASADWEEASIMTSRGTAQGFRLCYYF